MSGAWRWSLGLFYIFAVAAIWIAASYIVQSVVDRGVSPFLITYICNSLFIVYVPLAEIANSIDFRLKSRTGAAGKIEIGNQNSEQSPGDLEIVNLLPRGEEENEVSENDNSTKEEKEPWTRRRIAGVSLLISPFWFLAQLTFNLSLKYTNVTSNTILSSSSSLFTFLVSLAFLGEKFTWIKLSGVLLCMGGTVMVSVGDTESSESPRSQSPLIGDALALISALLYAIYITLIRKKLTDEEKGETGASMALFLGYLGFFNLVIFFPVALVLHFAEVEPFYKLTWNQLGLIVGKGLLDNVLSDYLWAKAVLLTSTTVATAGLAVQVPMAAVVDCLRGYPPRLIGFLGAGAAILGFLGLNFPFKDSSGYFWHFWMLREKLWRRGQEALTPAAAAVDATWRRQR